MATEIEHGLVFAFEDQSPSYTYGFEAGMIWQRIEAGERQFSVTCRWENKTTINRMVAARGGAVIFEEPNETWGEWATAHIEIGNFAPKKPVLSVVGGSDGR